MRSLKMEDPNARFVKKSPPESVTQKDTYYQSIVKSNSKPLAVTVAKHSNPNNPLETTQDYIITCTVYPFINDKTIYIMIIIARFLFITKYNVLVQLPT